MRTVSPTAGDRRQPLPFSRELIEKTCRRSHQGWLGCRVHAMAPDWLEIAVDGRADLASATGVLSPAALFGLVDSACGMALWQHRGVLGRQVTIDLRTDFLRPVRADRTVIVRAWCAGTSNRVAFMNAAVYERDLADPFCRAAASFMMFEEPAA